MSDLMRRVQCPECFRSFFVDEDDVDDNVLICPHCEAEITVEEEEE
ncbi:MAG: hypothetical protein O2913_14330 [Chloroflexi bacterium]|nr:hypothetical protein [Chloroflexota bacterium]